MNEPIQVPRKYGNKYFNLMEAPLSCWPATTQVELCYCDGRKETVEIPTAEVWVPGDFVARRYATTPFHKIQRWLNQHGYYNFSTFGVRNSPKLECNMDAPELAPAMEESSDADPGL